MIPTIAFHSIVRCVASTSSVYLMAAFKPQRHDDTDDTQRSDPKCRTDVVVHLLSNEQNVQVPARLNHSGGSDTTEAS
jgi:hypothetical protein